jgi:hypothetical protein
LDNVSYLYFISPLQRDKAFNTLIGILKGISIDGKIEKAELKELENWCADHHKYSTRHPFNEVFPKIKSALSDGMLDLDELQDLLWFCSTIIRDNPHYDAITNDIQQLQGMMHGITADGKIEKDELTALQSWINDNEQMRGCYPYDELNTLIFAVLKDGIIDSQEHEALMRFFNSFVSYSVSKQVSQIGRSSPPKKELMLGGVCAVCPVIKIPSNSFCISGLSNRGKKSHFASTVVELKGVYCDKVDPYLNYLVVGASGNPAWAYCCYGRKIEEAVALRKRGKPITIVHENDFWDAVDDIKAGVD